MRLGLLLFGLMAATTAAAAAAGLGAGMTGAALAYGLAGILSVLGGALFWAGLPESGTQALVLRTPKGPGADPARDALRPVLPARPPDAGHGPAHAPDSSAAA